MTLNEIAAASVAAPNTWCASSSAWFASKIEAIESAIAGIRRIVHNNSDFAECGIDIMENTNSGAYKCRIKLAESLYTEDYVLFGRDTAIDILDAAQSIRDVAERISRSYIIV